VAPVDDGSYTAARPGIALTDGISLGSKYLLNPNFGALQPLWSSNQLAVVLGSGHPGVTRSHFEDQDLCERAAVANVRSGWLGRHIQYSSEPSGTFRAITIGSRVVLSLTTNAYQSIALSSLDSFDLESDWRTGRDTLVNGIGALYGDAGGVLATQASATLDAVDHLGAIRTDSEHPYVPDGGANYPDTEWGRGLSDIARMVKADLGLEVACIDYGGWDMHQNLGRATDADGSFSVLARDFSAGLAAFRADVGSRWNRVTVVTMSEFGRRVEENGDGGTDHGQGNVMFALGGAVNGGVYGDLPTLSQANLVEGDVPISIDYRHALSEIVSKRLRNPNLDKVFPGFTAERTLGIV
jgi:uncharacterized protein (DUF1501 family)